MHSLGGHRGERYPCVSARGASGILLGGLHDLGVTNLCGAPTVCNVIANVEEAHRLEHPLRITTAGVRRRR